MIKMIVVLVNIICMVINDKDDCSSIECYSFMVINDKDSCSGSEYIICMVINDKDDCSISEYYLYGHK